MFDAVPEYPFEITERDLVDAQAKKIRAEYFLSLGILNSAFRQEAARKDMSVFEFRKYCQKCIAAYDNVYRNYNLTHDMPAEY